MQLDEVLVEYESVLWHISGWCKGFLRLFLAKLDAGERCKVLFYNGCEFAGIIENPRVDGSIPPLATSIPERPTFRLAVFLLGTIS
jgi:hypothetical protein